MGLDQTNFHVGVPVKYVQHFTG